MWETTISIVGWTIILLLAASIAYSAIVGRKRYVALALAEASAASVTRRATRYMWIVIASQVLKVVAINVVLVVMRTAG